jgi:arsenite methyltransferase
VKGRLAVDQHTSALHAPSTGLAASDAAWLNCSRAAFQTENEAVVRSIGIDSGWHVLDAGCGSGSFLPVLAGLVGPTGRLTALDLAPENIAAVREQLEQQPLTCPVDTVVSSILEMPFDDGTFDAVWVTQVLMYLSDPECQQALAEFHRVVRPGGLIAVKESSGPQCPYPADPAYWFPVLTHALTEYFPGARRSCALGKLLERIGLENVQQHSVVEEFSTPLDPAVRNYRAGQLAILAEMAEAVELPDGGRKFWAAQRDPNSAEALANHPDFVSGSISFVATGRVPETWSLSTG